MLLRKNKLLAMLMLLAMLLSLFAGCAKEEVEETGPSSVLLAFEGETSFNSDAVVQTIERYKENCVPYEVTRETAAVSFPVDHKCAASWVVLVSSVDETDNITQELMTYSTQEVATSVGDKTVEVDTGWWYEADSKTQMSKTWSYLVRVMDNKGEFHYYYFRVNYQNS